MTERCCTHCRKPLVRRLGALGESMNDYLNRRYCNAECRRGYDAARKARNREAKLAQRRNCPICDTPYGPTESGEGKYTFRQTCGDPVCLTEWKTQAQNNDTEGWPELTDSPITFAPWAFADNVAEKPALGRLPLQPVTFKPRASIQ